MNSIRVLVVEDHHVVRQGLIALLNVVDGLEVVGEAADGVEAITQIRKQQPDITLIDLRLPRLSGVDVIQRIRMENPQSRFIVLTTYDGDEDIYRALQAGARAYLLKGMTTDGPRFKSRGACGFTTVGVRPVVKENVLQPMVNVPTTRPTMARFP